MQEASLVGGDERSLGRKAYAHAIRAARRVLRSDGLVVMSVHVRLRRVAEPALGNPTTGGRPGSWSSPRHPDDAEFGPSGTAARWIDAGSVGWLVCCTSGDQGGEDPDADPLELAALREREQRAAAEVIGYEGVTFLHQPDGALVNDLALRELLVREIRTFQPDAVLCHRPRGVFHRGGGVNHTDHRAAGMAAVDAVYPAARNPMAFPALARAGLDEHVVRRLYLFWSERPDVWVDITDTVERKFAALAAHASQIREPAKLERTDP